MPARKNPVKYLSMNREKKELFSRIVPKLKTAAINAQKKNTFDGENLSDIVSNAKINVPLINPNWTAEVRCPRVPSLKLNVEIKLVITPFPANHNEVQQNCENTIIGRIIFDFIIVNRQIFKAY